MPSVGVIQLQESLDQKRLHLSELVHLISALKLHLVNQNALDLYEKGLQHSCLL